MPIKVIIIDDEPLARSIIIHYLSFHNDFEVIAECGDGFEAVKAITNHSPDLIFLDIQMPKITGFEMIELIENRPSIIFTTAFDEYAIKAFDQNAIDYLLKPFNKDRFDRAIQKFLLINQNPVPLKIEDIMINTSHHELETRIVVKHLGNIKIIPIQEVICIEAYDDYVKIHTDENVYVKKQTMSFFEKILNPLLFTRVHRSFIVQVNKITKIEQNDKEIMMAVLKNGNKIPLSKTGYPKLKTVLGI